MNEMTPPALTPKDYATDQDGENGPRRFERIFYSGAAGGG